MENTPAVFTGIYLSLYKRFKGTVQTVPVVKGESKNTPLQFQGTAVT